MAKGAIFLAVFLWSTVWVFAQEHSQDVWHEGKVVLRSGDTLKGELKYDLSENILQYKFGNRIVTLTPKKTTGFIIDDNVLKRERVFAVFGYNPYSTYKPLLFFEILVIGRLSLLARESVYIETLPQFDYFTNTTFYSTRRMVDYAYFFMKKSSRKDQDYDIMEYSEKKKQLVQVMGSKEDQVKDFIKENKVAYGTREGLVQVVNYYNSLYKPKKQNAD